MLVRHSGNGVPQRWGTLPCQPASARRSGSAATRVVRAASLASLEFSHQGLQQAPSPSSR